MEPFFTVGHGTRTMAEIVELANAAEIAAIIDVRRFPASRRHPHVGREALAANLPAEGIAYEWWGEALGGRRSRSSGSRNAGWRNASFQGYADHMATALFRNAILELERRARKERLAVMCAETLWWNCHRRLIADSLTLHGRDVVHILGPGKAQGHRLHPSARLDENDVVVYDVGVTPPLSF